LGVPALFEPPGGQILDKATADALLDGRYSDAFAVLGPHRGARGRIVRALLPGAIQVEALSRQGNRI